MRNFGSNDVPSDRVRFVPDPEPLLVGVTQFEIQNIIRDPGKSGGKKPAPRVGMPVRRHPRNEVVAGHSGIGARGWNREKLRLHDRLPLVVLLRGRHRVGVRIAAPGCRTRCRTRCPAEAFGPSHLDGFVVTEEFRCPLPGLRALQPENRLAVALAGERSGDILAVDLFQAVDVLEAEHDAHPLRAALHQQARQAFQFSGIGQLIQKDPVAARPRPVLWEVQKQLGDPLEDDLIDAVHGGPGALVIPQNEHAVQLFPVAHPVAQRNLVAFVVGDVPHRRNRLVGCQLRGNGRHHLIKSVPVVLEAPHDVAGFRTLLQDARWTWHPP